jgi:hypothetical protein
VVSDRRNFIIGVNTVGPNSRRLGILHQPTFSSTTLPSKLTIFDRGLFAQETVAQNPRATNFLRHQILDPIVGFVFASHDTNNIWQSAAFSEASVNDVRVGLSLADKADVAERRLRPKNNSAYPRLHTSGLLQARYAKEFLNSIGFAVHINYIAGSAADYEIVSPALLQTGVRFIRDGGNSFPFQKAINELSATGIKTTLVVSPPGPDMTVERMINDQIVPIVDAIVAVEGPNERDICLSSPTTEGRDSRRAFSHSQMYRE